MTNRGARLRGKSSSNQRDPADFQINQQKPQALIHPATHFGGEWEEITQGRGKGSDFMDVLSSIEAVSTHHNSTARFWWQLAQHPGETIVNLSRILDHLSDGKRPVTKSCASGSCG